jgi:hypothetical protein
MHHSLGIRQLTDLIRDGLMVRRPSTFRAIDTALRA